MEYTLCMEGKKFGKYPYPTERLRVEPLENKRDLRLWSILDIGTQMNEGSSVKYMVIAAAVALGLALSVVVFSVRRVARSSGRSEMSIVLAEPVDEEDQVHDPVQ